MGMLLAAAIVFTALPNTYAAEERAEAAEVLEPDEMPEKPEIPETETR